MILIISANEDIHAQAVMRELARHDRSGARMLNLSGFPVRFSLNMRFDNNGHCDHELHFADRTVSMKEVSAVWWRRPQPFGIPAEVKDPAARQFAMSEAAKAFQGMWQSSRALWVNNIQREAAASHKPYQLALAKEIGLRIPETLITNDPEEARDFWSALPGQVVYKPFTASLESPPERRIVKPEEERMAESVRLAPVIFQKYVAGKDLRITVIGDRVFPAEADTRPDTGLHYRRHDLPPAMEQKLLAFMRRLGLEYGAIDMRLTLEGEYVFLEVNPAGQFLYVELATGMKIAAALADRLAAGKEPSAV